MADECPKCDAEVTDVVATHRGPDPEVSYACGSAYRYGPSLAPWTSFCRRFRQSRQCIKNQIAQLGKKLKVAQDTLDRLHDGGLDCPQLIDDSMAFWDRIEDWMADPSKALTITEQRELAGWWLERGTLVSQLDEKLSEAERKLTTAETVVQQYQHEPEPSAWRVLCPKGHEYDFLVFPDENDAVAVADEFNDVSDDGWVTSAEPLFARQQAAAKAKERANAS